jgi:hypothetical protein
MLYGISIANKPLISNHDDFIGNQLESASAIII